MSIIHVDRDSAAASPEVPDGTRIRVRRRRTRRRGARVVPAVGVTMLVAGALVLSWLAWEFWGTNWVSHQRQHDVVEQLHRDWDHGQATSDTSWGTADAILRVPRFGKSYEVPILEGTSDDVLAAGIGHMEHTQDVGQKGNYVLAAHRVTHGEPFADFPDLRDGDVVYVDTVSTTYEYVLDTDGNDLVVPFTTSWVIDPFPVNPVRGGPTPPLDVGDRLITLVTCSEIFHTDNRSVAFGHLRDSYPRVPGRAD